MQAFAGVTNNIGSNYVETRSQIVGRNYSFRARFWRALALVERFDGFN
jgi:hypothetical protein